MDDVDHWDALSECSTEVMNESSTEDRFSDESDFDDEENVAPKSNKSKALTGIVKLDNAKFQNDSPRKRQKSCAISTPIDNDLSSRYSKTRE